MTDYWNKVSAATAAAIGVTGAAAYMWATSEPGGYKIDLSTLEQQSVEVPDIPACRMSKLATGRPVQNISPYGDSTLYDCFLNGVKRAGTKPCLGKRSSPKTGFDCWMTYDEVLERVTNIGYGLRGLGLEPGNSTYVGMFSKNRAEMLMSQFGCYQHSMVMVPMYDTLGDEGLDHIINQTSMKVIICDSEDKVQKLASWGQAALTSVTTLVHMNDITPATRQSVLQQNWKCISFEELESEGRKNPVKQVVCQPEDVCIVCYTSGTTGKPKGAMLTHRSCHVDLMDCLQTIRMVDNDFLAFGEEVHLSYLPLAHLYEQIIVHMMSQAGGRIGFFSGDVKELLNDIQYLKPTVFPSVPRLLTRIYDKVMNAVSQSSIKSYLFEKGLQQKEAYFRKGYITKDTIWDKLVFRKIQNMFGGRVKCIITGAAPISPPILRFFRLALGSVVMEGYGQTECSAACSLTFPGEYKSSEVGPPLPSAMIKLADVAEMKYFASNNMGEVCIYGPMVFKGYLYDVEKTKEAMDDEGWLHTGDIGQWTERGTLKIIDRKKHIFKLAQGEYVAPEKIENIYVTSSLVAQCFVHGDSLKASLVAIVVPDPEVLPGYAKSKLGLEASDMAALCSDERVRKLIQDEMVAVGKQGGLKGFEQVRDIYLSPDLFSVENNLLTPTFKLKRVESRQAFKDQIEVMYRNLE